MLTGAAYAQAPVERLGGSSSTSQLTLEQRLSQLERVMDARNKAQMALLEQLTALQDEVALLRGKTEEHAYQLEQVMLRQREIYQEIDRRLAATPTPAVTVPVDNAGTVSAGTPSASYSADLNENDAYDQAIKLVLEDKRYDAAIPAFRQFIERFPNSTYAPNAHYWLGQLLFADGQFDEAKQEFAMVMEQYPDSNKRADSILKLGIIAQEQKQPQSARAFYQQVLSEYGDSTEASLAQKRLAEL